MLSPNEWTVTPEAALFIHEPSFSGRCTVPHCQWRDYKRLFMELTSNVLQNDECRKATAAQVVGKNSSPAHASEWVFNPQVHIDTHGNLVSLDQSSFLWLETHGSTNALTNSQTGMYHQDTSQLCMVKHSMQCVQQRRHLCLKTPPQFLQPWQHAWWQVHTKMSFHAVGAVEYHYSMVSQGRASQKHCVVAWLFLALRVLTFITVKPLHLTCLMSSNRQQSPSPLMTSMRKHKTLGRNSSLMPTTTPLEAQDHTAVKYFAHYLS